MNESVSCSSAFAGVWQNSSPEDVYYYITSKDGEKENEVQKSFTAK